MSDYTYDVIVRKVVDGDTADVDIDLGFDVWLKNQRIRFMGIDTPESRTSDKQEKVFGKYAKEYVKSFIPVGSKQELITFKDGTGKFGRILGDFVVEHEGKQQRLCQLMIQKSIGVAYFGQSKDDIAQEHLDNRQILIEQGLVTL